MSSSVKIASRDGGDQSNNDRRNSTDDERPDPSSIKLPQVCRVELLMLAL